MMAPWTRRLLPLLLVLAASLGVAAALGVWLGGRDTLTLQRFGHVLLVQQPRALWLLAALPWLWLATAASLTDLSRAQLALQLGGRAVLLVLLVLALSQPALQDQRRTVSMVALLDVSDSMTDRQVAAQQAAVEALRATAARRGDELHLIRFGARPQVLAAPAGPLPPLRGDVLGPGRDGSDLQAALRLSYGLHSPGTLRRALLLSDGNQTEGDVLAEAQAARGRGVRLFTRSLRAEQEPEVLVRELRLAGGPDAELKVGAPFTLEAEVYSSAAQRARVTLLRDSGDGAAYVGSVQRGGAPFIENPGDGHRDVDLVPGSNLLRFRSEVAAAGYVTYRAQVGAAPGGAPLRDRFRDNNQATLALSIKGRPHILYVEGESAAAGYLQRALARENIDVDVRNPYGLPSSARELQRYDLLLLSDVSSTLISQAQMAAIETYVRDLGGGFVMTGGENSFGSGGYQGTLIEKILPVRFEQEKKRDQPSLGLVLCIDRSGSMNGPKLELAKDAARATAELLAPDDLIGVVAFDSQATALVRLQRAQNRIRISSDISRLQAGGGTQILPPLQEAYQQLSAATAKIKHVILLTDGQAEYQGILELVDRMVEQKITVSAVGVGAGADQTLLTAIAEHGGGRFYFTQDATSIPKIFTKETTQVARSALVEDAVRVVVQKRVELLDGTAIETAPALRGYVATKTKPLSETILASHLGEPILVRWRLGLGQAVAFTSDVKNRWAVDWLRWPGYGKFWAQVIRSSMRHDPRTRGNGYDLSATAVPPRVQVRVDAISADDRFVSGLRTTLEVIAPRSADVADGLLGVGPGPLGTVVAVAPMTQTAPGRYEAELALRRYGSFLLRAVHRAAPTPTDTGAAGAAAGAADRSADPATAGPSGPIVAESWGTLSLSYPREYLALPPDLELLRRSAELTGGRALDDVPTEAALAEAALIPGPTEEPVRFFRPLWPYLCGLAIALLLLDVALRRVRLFGYRPLSL